MTHLPLLPFLIPFSAAALLLLLGQQSPLLQRGVAMAATLAGLTSALALLATQGSGPVLVTALGDWPAPYGILFVVDRLAAQMVVLLFLLAVPALLMAADGADLAGRHFHALFQLQLAGLAGAFLTGDLFNLFVFFEILLLASYTLLVHGNGPARSRAGLLYVILNLMGSSLFLVALALIYGTLGTLNMADIARLLPLVPADDVPLVRAGFAILIGVFLLKSALLPMALWLPHVYSAASMPVAALFAILTKVGIVAMLRLTVTVFGDAPVVQGLLQPWLPVLALGTVAFGVVALFAADRLRVAAASLVLISSGILLFAVAFPSERGTAALLFYLPHTVLATGGMMMLAGLIAARRGALEDRLVRGPCVGNRRAIGSAYALFAVAIAGLPPLSGFLGKLMLMQAGAPEGWRAAWWAALLLSGFAVTLVLVRVAALIFWQPDHPLPDQRTDGAGRAAILLLALASPAIVVLTAPLSAWTLATSTQLLARTPYLDAVLGDAPPTQRERRP
jgi:multicomponent K+:H+ antiporter subunit D